MADPLTYQTAETDIFVGGDVYTGPKFAIDAIAAGREGAISIHRFVQPHSSLTIGRNRRDFIELDKDNIRVEEYDNSSRQIPGKNASIDAKRSFRDPKLTFTEEQVRKETARCLAVELRWWMRTAVSAAASAPRSASLTRSIFTGNTRSAAPCARPRTN